MEQFLFLFVIFILVITFIFKLWLSILNYRNRNAKIPEEVVTVYDQDAYHKWLLYTMENNRIGIISSTIYFIIDLSFLLFGIFPLIFGLAQYLSNSYTIQTLIFIATYYIILFVVNIFFSYYKQFRIEERYGFNKSTKTTFVVDKIKNLILTSIIGGGIIYSLLILFLKIENIQTFFFVSLVMIMSIIVFFSLFYVKLIIPIFNKLTPLADGSLKDKIVNFADKVGYKISNIKVVNASKRSTKLNAYISGYGRFKKIVLYDTLIEKMDDDQILSVLAHEIGHSKHNHLVKLMLINVILIGSYLSVLVYTLSSNDLSQAFGFEESNFGFGLISFMILISPISIILNIFNSYISRRFEYQADHFAAVNGYKQAIEESLIILARENFDNLTPHPLFVTLRYSHPPIAFRIRAIRKVDVNE